MDRRGLSREAALGHEGGVDEAPMQSPVRTSSLPEHATPLTERILPASGWWRSSLGSRFRC